MVFRIIINLLLFYFLFIYFSHNIYVEGLLFSRPWVCRDRIAGIELFRPPRGTRDSVIVVVVVVMLYLALKLIHWLVFIFCSWAVFFVWNPIITTKLYYIQKSKIRKSNILKSNIQHWDRNSNFHFKPSKRCTQRSYREIGAGAGILTTRRIFLARPQACRSSILLLFSVLLQ